MFAIIEPVVNNYTFSIQLQRAMLRQKIPVSYYELENLRVHTESYGDVNVRNPYNSISFHSF